MKVMFSIQEKDKIVAFKSVHVLKWAVPVFCICALIEYVLVFHHSALTTGNKYLVIDLLFAILMIPTLLFPFLIFAAIVGFLVDMILIFLERK